MHLTKRAWNIKITAAACVGLVAALLLSAAPAYAQPEKRVHVNIGGGYTFSLSDVRDHLGDGYNFNLGVTVKATDMVAIQGEYGFNGLGDKRISIPVSPNPGDPAVPTDFFADMNMQFGDVNLVFKAPSGNVRPYVLAGIGVYYRPVKVTTPAVGYLPGYCDPYWYICYPGAVVPVDKIVGERSSTDFGMNFGGGFDVAMGDTAFFYVEARYHYIWGPTVQNQTGIGSTEASKKANGQFLPLTFGFRF